MRILTFKLTRIVVTIFMVMTTFSCAGDSFDDLEDSQLDYTSPIYTDALIIAQWNIGHFSNGVSTKSKINGSNFEQKKTDFQALISSIPADVYCINEYSVEFGTDSLKEKHITEKLLFSEFPYLFIGHQRNYSCNAVFSKLNLDEINELEYNCNQTAIITHSSAIKAKQYYFIESIIKYKDVEIKLVNTHLAFDKNNTEVALNQIRELIERYKDEEYVVLCGDWNTGASSFKLFSEAGYQLGNHGVFGSFITRDVSKGSMDNIIAKGLKIVDFRVVNSKLSDHKPVVAALILP